MANQTKKLSEKAAVNDTSGYVIMDDGSGSFKRVPFSALMGEIKIGGRNLLKNSGQEIATKSYKVGQWSYTSNSRPRLGERLIATIWGEAGDGRTLVLYNGEGNGMHGYVNLTKVADGIYRGVLPINDETDTCAYLFQTPQSATSESTVRCIKLERGNIATDWTPAPEDILGGGVKPYAIACCTAQEGGQHEQSDQIRESGSACFNIGRSEHSADRHFRKSKTVQHLGTVRERAYDGLERTTLFSAFSVTPLSRCAERAGRSLNARNDSHHTYLGQKRSVSDTAIDIRRLFPGKVCDMEVLGEVAHVFWGIARGKEVVAA